MTTINGAQIRKGDDIRGRDNLGQDFEGVVDRIASHYGQSIMIVMTNGEDHPVDRRDEFTLYSEI